MEAVKKDLGEALGALLIAVIMAVSIPWGTVLDSIRDSLLSLVPSGPYALLLIFVIIFSFAMLKFESFRDSVISITSALIDFVSSILPKR